MGSSLRDRPVGGNCLERGKLASEKPQGSL